MLHSRYFFVLTLASGVAATVSAWVSTALSLTFLGVSVLALAGWLLLRLRGLSVERERDARRAAAIHRELLRTTHAELAESLLDIVLGRLDQLDRSQQLGRAAVDKHAARIVQRLDRQRDAVQRLPSTTVELERAYRRLAPDLGTMPMLGGWALTPGVLLGLLELVEDRACRTILECGSGASTVWFAAALEQRGGDGRVVSLDSDPVFAQQTRDELAARGLAHRAVVIDAPLVDVAAGGRPPRAWYTVDDVPDGLEVDLLLVDGPTGFSATQARYPAFPLLAHLLRAGSTVVLDDATRPEEQQILAAWTAEEHAGRRLREVRRLDRAVVLTTERA